MVQCSTFIWTVIKFRTPLLVMMVPLILLSLPLTHGNSPESLVAFLMIMMAVFWCTDIIPIPITALIPIVYLPLTGVMKVSDVAVNYMKDLILLMIGGLIVALAIEKCGLHKRVALFILKLIGVEQKRLLFGFMFVTWLLSMFISNTAATAMMLPISDSVIQQLVASGSDTNTNNNSKCTSNSNKTDNEGINKNKDVIVLDNIDCATGVESDDQIDQEWQPEERVKTSAQKAIEKAFTLAIPYSANIGGTAFLTGTPPNIVVKSQVETIWEEKHGLQSPITFASWTVYALPISAILIVFIWGYLILFYFTFRKGEKQTVEQRVRAEKIINNQWKELGYISLAECAVAVNFVILIILWFFRDPQFVDGWSIGFKKGYLKDAIPAIFIAIVLFIIPSERPTWKRKSDRPIEFLMDWNTVQQKMPWGIFPLLGGGMALADAATRSGLSAVISDQLSVIGNLNGSLVVGILCLAVAMLTEVTSNTATCNLLMPVMELLSQKLGYSPLYLMLPIGLSCSFAFMLPVSTPPNAIAFATGKIRIMDMVLTGALLNVICVVVITVVHNTWGYKYFDMGVIPWLDNSTHV